MKPIKLKVSALIDSRDHPAGSIVMVNDNRAAELINLDHAEAVEGAPKVANPDHNPLADCIHPEPPGGLVINPIDALAPNVNDNPGLKKAVELTGKSAKVQAAKLTADVASQAKGTPPKVEATTTANEIVTSDPVAPSK